MLAYLRAMWRCRFFWLNLVRIDLRTRYRRSLLGVAWSLAQPLTMTAMFCLIVRPLLMPERSLAECGLFFLIGLICWQFLVNVTVQGCTALLRGEAYIRQHPAPLAIWPLRTVLGFGAHLLVVLVPVTLLSCLWHGGIPVAFAALAPGMALWLLFGWSLAVLAAFGSVYYQDTQHFCEVGFQMIFYVTPILYDPEVLRAKSLDWLLHLNPLTPFFHLVREPLLHGRMPEPAAWLWAGVVVSLFVTAACTMLATQQRRVIFYM